MASGIASASGRQENETVAISDRTLPKRSKGGTSALLRQSPPHGKDSTCSPTSPHLSTVAPLRNRTCPRSPEEAVSNLRRWHSEAATDGHGFWLVGLETYRVHVIAPPAVALNRHAEPCRRGSAIPRGWRWAIWTRHEGLEPSIDEDPADKVSEIDTTTVLLLIDDELHERVWSCLWAQLQIVRQIKKQRPGHVLEEDLARAGALSATWLQHELARAFPERLALLEPNIDLDDCNLQGDSVQLISSCLRTPDHPHEGALLRTIARWLSEKVGTTESDYQTHRHVWHAGEILDGTCQSAIDPGDHSEFNWDDIPTDNEPDPLTEEMLLP